MNISVLHFNLQKVTLPDGAQASDLLLEFQYPQGTRVYVNDVPVPTDYVLSDGDEVFLRRPERGGGIAGGAPLLGMEPLREFALGAEHLIVIDPYILCPPEPRDGQSREEAGLYYAETLAVVAGANPRLRLHLIYLEGNRYTRPALEHACDREGCRLTMKRSEKIHDRIWIKDREKALAAGTSLNSANGRKLAFVLPLPASDLHFVKQFMEENNLLPSV